MMLSRLDNGAGRPRHRTPLEEKRESIKNDALRAWNAFRGNGKHLTGEEANAWLARMEDVEDTDVPECHD